MFKTGSGREGDFLYRMKHASTTHCSILHKVTVGRPGDSPRTSNALVHQGAFCRLASFRLQWGREPLLPVVTGLCLAPW